MNAWAQQIAGISRYADMLAENASLPRAAQLQREDALITRREILDWMRDTGSTPTAKEAAALWHLSEESGRSHLYVMTEEGAIKALNVRPRRWGVV